MIGYIARAIACKQTPNWTLGPYIVDTILVLVAPALFAATIYMELGRIIELTKGERYSIVRKKWLTKIFVGGDVLSFLMQSGGETLTSGVCCWVTALTRTGGGIMAGKTASSVKLGQHIVVGGLIVQIVFFGFFVVVAAVFHVRIDKQPTPTLTQENIPWKRHINALYAASGLILVRSIFRVAEYQQGNDGYLLGHEAFLYVFDAVLMLGVMVLLNVVHPSEIYTLLRRARASQPESELSSVTQSPETVKS